MPAPPRTESLPEPELNDLLRRVDWRFLLANRSAPRILDLDSGVPPGALERIGETASGDAAPDLVLTGFPRRRQLDRALRALGPGGEVVCLWRAPRPGGAARARKRLLRAGLVDARVYWPGPLPFRAPQFWLPVESAAAVEYLLAARPARSRAQRALRRAWRLGARAGLLAPCCAVARVPGDTGQAPPDSLASLGGGHESWLLLTGGQRSINKVVGLPFAEGVSRPSLVTKFARVPASGASLEHEAETLSRIETDHPAITGVPRLLASDRRAGCRALAETAVLGEPLITALAPSTLEPLAARVGEWLTGLVDRTATRSAAEYQSRLVEEPLRQFERDFGVAAPGAPDRCRAILERLGDLPAASEHRDCSPWNVVVGQDDSIGLLDWESAEPEGLPGLDLIYFLANAAFVLDSALETGVVRPTYSRLLNPATEYGRVFDRCTAEYCSRLGLPVSELHRLRLLCWIVHSHSDYRHLAMGATGTPSREELRTSMFLGLIEEELSWNERRNRS